MADVAHIFGGDLTFSPSGDLSIVAGTEEGRQRVLRRVLTGKGNYIWNPAYGGSLPETIGSLKLPSAIEAAVREQMLLEEVVAQVPPPVVSVTQPTLNATAISVKYNDALTGSGVLLGVTLTP